MTDKAGLRAAGWANGVCVADYNNDGFDDIFCTYYGHNRLYRNNGDGTFTDVTNNQPTNPATTAQERERRYPCQALLGARTAGYFLKQKPATGSPDEHHKSCSTHYAYDIYLKKWVLPRWRSYRLSEVKAVDVEDLVENNAVGTWKQGQNQEPDERLVFSCNSMGVDRTKTRSRAYCQSAKRMRRPPFRPMS